MSLHAYLESRSISATDPDFSALIFAAYRKADTFNAAKLQAAWPDLCAEMQRRYDAPGGALTDAELAWLLARDAGKVIDGG